MEPQSDHLDHVPLVQRRRILITNSNENPLIRFGLVKEEQQEHGCDSIVQGTLEQERSCIYKDPAEAEFSKVGSCVQNGNCSHDVGTSRRDGLNDCLEQIESRELDDASVCHREAVLDVPPSVKVECSDVLLHSEGEGVDSSSGSGVLVSKVKDEVCDYGDDDYLDHVVLKERQRMLLSRKLRPLEMPVWEGDFEELAGDLLQQAVSGNETANFVMGAPLASKDDMNVSYLSSSFKTKDEPCGDNCHNSGTSISNTFSFSTQSIMTKAEVSGEFYEDDADNMCLRDRLKRRRSQGDSDIKMSRKYEFLSKSVSFDTNFSPTTSEHDKIFGSSRPRKRKRTATYSVEKALDEDAPGLLKELIAKGVLVDEIKLYGETESDEAIDESSIKESFSELGSVISKIFTQHQSFLKSAPMHFSKGSRPSYCLACLLSLVEQTRYLQFRKWPVEWGWSRDLQSFIFIFERHNRIVLERPEYGYATYFFELVDSSPIDWQIKRLVTAMKLTSCSRISLIENKPLSVGEDLTKGEAKVLIQYGWVPNSGLGTMLRYRDRVVHDRKNEKDTSEWKSKIGKLLMDGYNGGLMASTYIPDMECNKDSQQTQIKLEQ